MFRPISKLGVLMVGYAALQPLTRGSTATSSEAEAISDAACKVVRNAESSQSLFGEKAVAISALQKLAQECATADWDSNGASAMNPVALNRAIQFIRALPNGIRMPEFAPEPDGSLSFDWIASRHRLFSLSVGKSDRLAFAWLDGSDTGHGVAQFDGSKIPSRIFDQIQAIVKHGDTPLRAV